MALTLELVDEIPFLSVIIEMKTTEQYFPLVLRIRFSPFPKNKKTLEND